MPGEEKIWTVSDVNSAVREVLEGAFAPFWLEGEIGTLTVHRSGHVYLILKDDRSQLRAVIWRGADIARKMALETGARVEALGHLTAYEPRGEYQFNIRTLRSAGQGDLARRFEELKAKLAAEGLFDAARKKPLPELPRTIGVVTSPDGAAIRDFLKIIRRRFPNVTVRIYPAAVQGKGAEKGLAAGVRFFNLPASRVEVIVLTRGGGSMEDLWAFNEEVLARAIAASRVPVISAVGHEVDFTIGDFAADVRAPTPSAAAEMVIAAREELETRISTARRRLRSAMLLRVERFRRRYQRLADSYVFREPARLVRERQQRLDEFMARSRRALDLGLERGRRKHEALALRLRALDPKAALRRGYAILRERVSGALVTAPGLPPGTPLRALVADGEIPLRIDTDGP